MLLLILLFNISGHFVTFKLSQHSIKKEIKRKIKSHVPETELTVFTFSIAELNKLDWEEKGKEFSLKGNMYDVVKKQQTADSITLYCINDIQEKSLFANLEELINRQMNSDERSSNISLKKFQTDYFFIHTELQFSFTGICSLPVEITDKLLKGFLSDTLQPPKQA
ncbi:MAG: hypothetical protein POELPBGB_02307 [Bacteroidia bacterium]|nr:hypothetical protein [Bacteroidia bacterium]